MHGPPEDNSPIANTATTIINPFDPNAVQMFEAYKKIQIQLGRKDKKIKKLKQQRDYWKEQCDRSKVVIECLFHAQYELELKYAKLEIAYDKLNSTANVTTTVTTTGDDTSTVYTSTNS